MAPPLDSVRLQTVENVNAADISYRVKKKKTIYLPKRLVARKGFSPSRLATIIRIRTLHRLSACVIPARIRAGNNTCRKTIAGISSTVFD